MTPTVGAFLAGSLVGVIVGGFVVWLIMSIAIAGDAFDEGARKRERGLSGAPRRS